MGPKKGKEIINENNWRTSIEGARLDQDNWKVKVVIMEAAGSDQDRIYLNKFENFAAKEKRFVIKNICKSETTFMINQLGERKVKDDNYRVFEEGQAYLKEKKEIPPDLLALIIKHLILKIKEEYLFIRQQRLEVKEGMRRESTTMVDKTEVRGTVSVQAPESADSEPVSKSKSKKSEPEPTSQTSEPSELKKYNTLLRVRGEEWRDKIYVDDFPIDGPNIYVAITGFIEPCLPSALIKIGIPLTAIIQVRIDSTTVTRVPSSLLRPTKRGQSQTEILTGKSQKFWEDLQQLRINRNSASGLKNTAFVVFSPPYWDSESLSGNPDKIYDECCYLMYDVQDLSRQHAHYLKNMDTINISKDVADHGYYKCYDQHMQDLPLECITIYSVLDSMLQTVEKNAMRDGKSSKTSLSTVVAQNQHKSNDGNDKIEKAEKLVKQVFNTLCKTDGTNEKFYRITYGEECETHKHPIIIQYGDLAKYTTFHLGNIDLEKIVWSSLFGMPINKLWQCQIKPQGELEAKINFHINVLLSCFERKDVETAELKRLLHILACRKVYNNRSSLKKKHLASTTISDFKKVYLKRSVLAEPLPQCPSLLRSSSTHSPSFPSITKSDDDSGASYDGVSEAGRVKFLFDCPDISELVSAAEILNAESIIDHMIDDFAHFEDFSGISAFQILREAFNEFNCVDYKYCQVTDSMILMFFNSHNNDGIAREEWRCHIPTPLCLQDFFDFVLEEHYDWIQNEEKVYDEKMVLMSQSECQEIVDPFAAKSCVANSDVKFELLMEGSLKFQELLVDEESVPEITDTKGTSSKKTTVSPNSTETDYKNKMSKSSAPSTPKNIKQSYKAPTNSNEVFESSAKVFSGYDLGDRRVEIFGRNSMFFSRDGTRVSSKYTLTIPMNLEYIILNVTSGNGTNEFWFHKAIGEFLPTDIIDTCESFRITTRDQVMINIKKQTYQVPTTSMSLIHNSKGKDTASLSYSENVHQVYETKYFHSLFITWPNGLITESVHFDNSPAISHIKQFYLCDMPHLDEEMRCITLNGEVIVFKPSGVIEVLVPDGSCIKITKYEKNKVQEKDIISSETYSEKSKKGKGKEKDKVKSSKPSPKTSKNAINDEDKIISHEYELVIKEFETIATDGLRLKWVNEIPSYVEHFLIRTATDFGLREVFSRRMDGTNILLNKDGIQVVTFPNNTRIISTFYVETEEIYPEWTEEEKEYLQLFDSSTTDTAKSKVSQKNYNLESCTYNSIGSAASKKLEEEEIDIEKNDGYISVQMIFTIEHANYSTVTINKSNNNISILSPNDTNVVMDSANNYTIQLDNSTTANFDGNTLVVDYEACNECRSNTNIIINVKTDEMISTLKSNQHWLKMKDSFCKKVVVNEEGSISTIDEPCSTEILHTGDIVNNDNYESNTDAKQLNGRFENSCISHGKCGQLYTAKTTRFFVLSRELSCSELVHRVLLERYKQSCRRQPWCSINEYNTFGDHRSLLSILMPVPITESEKWLMDSKLSDKPKYLTFKDLKKDLGKGFYQWMRPYERYQAKPLKPATVLSHALPRAFVQRTLEQQWKESERDCLKGARELRKAILRYRHVMESDAETILHVPIRDPRLEDERRTDDVVQAIGRRIYEDLKSRLADDVQTRSKADITTNPSTISAMMSEEGEMEEDLIDLHLPEAARESLVKEVEEAEQLSPNLRKYWQRREEEANEEQFYIHLLREGSVPSYFRNVLGGAIWWDMNKVAGEAAVKAERNKMKCPCVAEEATSNADTVPFK